MFNQYKSKTKELEELESADQALLFDLMKFQYEELEEASLKEGEIEQLEVDIRRIQNHLQSIDDILPDKFSKLKEDIDQFYYTLEDAKHELYDEMSNTEFDEQMLNELESRMNLLNNLKRKYGKDINELITKISFKMK